MSVLMSAMTEVKFEEKKGLELCEGDWVREEGMEIKKCGYALVLHVRPSLVKYLNTHDHFMEPRVPLRVYPSS
jgi:hypothetical protein